MHVSIITSFIMFIHINTQAFISYKLFWTQRFDGSGIAKCRSGRKYVCLTSSGIAMNMLRCPSNGTNLAISLLNGLVRIKFGEVLENVYAFMYLATQLQFYTRASKYMQYTMLSDTYTCYVLVLIVIPTAF